MVQFLLFLVPREAKILCPGAEKSQVADWKWLDSDSPDLQVVTVEVQVGEIESLKVPALSSCRKDLELGLLKA